MGTFVARRLAPTAQSAAASPGWDSLAATGAVGCFPVMGSWDEIGKAMLAGLSSVRGLGVLAPWLVFAIAVLWMTHRARAHPVVAYDPRGSRLMTAQYTVFFTMLVHSLLFWRAEIDRSLAAGGAVVLGVGALLYLRALPHLARGYNPMVCVRAGQQVCTRGPYGLVRHPSYAGQMLMMLGTALVMQHYDYLGLPIPFYIMYRTARAEEELLSKHYREYAGYRQRTWMFVPYVL
jgi:protein-S-isoprenylcysteine O-methyltransferase Ste14